MKKDWLIALVAVLGCSLLNGEEIEAIQASPVLTQSFSSLLFELIPDSTPNSAWRFDGTSLSSANGNVYFLQGSTEGITSSPVLSLSFETSSLNMASANSSNAAWYFDTGVSGVQPFDGAVYYLSGSVTGITASPQLLLSFNGTRPLFVASRIPNKAWYFDTSNVALFNATIYYLNGSISGITESSLTNVAFIGGTPSVVLDSNPNAAWFFDQNGDSAGNVYYLLGSGTSFTASDVLSCTFQNFGAAALVADTAQNTAWYADITNSGGTSTIYYLEGQIPTIEESNQSFSFSTTTLGVSADQKPNAAWFYDAGGSEGFSGEIYYLEGALSGISSSSSASFTFQTHQALFRQSGTQNRGWYFDSGAVSSPGFDGSVYYLDGSLSGISSSAATFPFHSRIANLTAGRVADTAWFYDSFTTVPASEFPGNVYYLSGSTAAISSAELTLSFNTGIRTLLVDPSSGGAWYVDQGGLTATFDGKIYYLLGSTSGISSIGTELAFNTALAGLQLADSNAVWYYDRGGTGEDNGNVYYVKAILQGSSPPSLSVFGWTSGTQGALLNSVFNMTFAQTKTLQERVSRRGAHEGGRRRPAWSNTNFFASAPDMKNRNNIEEECSLPCLPQPSEICAQKARTSPYLVQVAPFYDFIQQGKQGSIPEFNNHIVGALATFDAQICPFIVGGGAGYTYNYANLMEGLGHANIHQEVGVVYSTWENERLFVDATLWGGFYQLGGVRESSGNFTANYSTQGYTLTPHLELKVFTLSKDNWLLINPFVMSDWAILWQKEYTEKGVSQTSVAVSSQSASFLRTEVGLYVQQFFCIDWGQIELLEKASYINQTPFQHNEALPLFIGSSPLFSIGTGTLSMQNLGAVAFRGVFYPNNRKWPFFGLALQGEFGSGFASYLIGMEVGADF